MGTSHLYPSVFNGDSNWKLEFTFVQSIEGTYILVNFPFVYALLMVIIKALKLGLGWLID